MFEKTLRDLAVRGFEIMWRYEIMTNAIFIRLERRGYDHTWYRAERVVGFEEIGCSGGFELSMILLLKYMAEEMERDMKGENNDA